MKVRLIFASKNSLDQIWEPNNVHLFTFDSEVDNEDREQL